MEQLFDKEDQLWAYLTQKWLMIKQPSNDNVSRWQLKKKWKVIQGACVSHNPSPLIREVVRQGNLVQLLNQGVGIMLSVAAIGKHNSLEEAAKVFRTWAENKLNEKKTTFDIETDVRRSKYLN